MLEFDGVGRNSTVWVNGFLLGTHFNGYTPFSYDISDVARYGDEGENVVFVKVDASQPEGWWYEGAGMYRHVWMTVTEKVHIAPYGVFVSTKEASDDSALLNVEITLENDSDAWTGRMGIRSLSYTRCDGADKDALADVIRSCGFPADVRGERLGIPEFAALSKALRSAGA